ncbi:hypothetical protein NQ176_g217 [Zarea fungicola]|uniref:Uncharacterized protein n=1 Tax=Zarea fungicola TaxID=93591 RepID=A0ACC1P020_9HYPO|nr:hypothetical protein NQ176_g217 [Lecanicillium fungicola]
MSGEKNPGGDVMHVMHGIVPSSDLHNSAEEYTKHNDNRMPRIARWASFQEDSLISESNLLENEEYLEQQHESSTSNCNSTGFDGSSANTYETTTNDSNEVSTKLHGSISPEKTASNTGDFHLRVDHEMALPPLVVEAPVQYVASLPGKKIRDKAAKALNIWLKVGEQDLSQITDVVGLLHSASLVLDDVEDGSSCRRGKPAAHTIFGQAQAINSAGFQINKALLEVMKLGDPRCMAIFSEEMENLYVGQAYDLYWTFNSQRPTFKEYIAMVDHKTGALFNMLVKLMAAKSTAISEPNPDLFNLVILLGRFFQIRDDYMNLTSDDKNGTKQH